MDSDFEKEPAPPKRKLGVPLLRGNSWECAGKGKNELPEIGSTEKLLGGESAEAEAMDLQDEKEETQRLFQEAMLDSMDESIAIVTKYRDAETRQRKSPSPVRQAAAAKEASDKEKEATRTRQEESKAKD